MRILLVPNTAASMVWFREPFLRGLVARGHRVWVAAPEGWGTDRVVATGASFVPVFQHQGWAFGAQEQLASSYVDPTKDLTFLREMRRICRVIRPELVLSYTHKMAVLVPWAARLAGVPRVHGMITGLGYANLKGGLKQTLMRGAYHASIRAAGAASDSIILLNRDNVDEVVGAGLVPAEKVHLMDGEGVDLDRFAAPPVAWERGRMTFLMVARLVRYKGVGEFVEAARIVHGRFPEARFVVAGTSDPHHPSAIPEAELDAWRAEGVVSFPGHVDDVRGLIAASHAFVLPSWETEGLPMSIMEAMAAGRPIITTAVPGNRETVSEGENGHLVAPNDPAALADAMCALLADPDGGAKMGRASRDRCAARFDHRIVNAALFQHLGV